MKIILVRHGEAEHETQIDSQRQLTPLGKQQAEQTAEYITDKYSPDTFVVSPYDRALQTLAAFTERASDVEVTVINNITPNDDVQSALSTLMRIEGACVVVVCHMPIVAKLAALITGTSPESYSLAEARIIKAEFIAADMGNEVDRFIPQQS